MRSSPCTMISTIPGDRSPRTGCVTSATSSTPDAWPTSITIFYINSANEPIKKPSRNGRFFLCNVPLPCICLIIGSPNLNQVYEKESVISSFAHSHRRFTGVQHDSQLTARQLRRRQSDPLGPAIGHRLPQWRRIGPYRKDLAQTRQ